mgnify:CR=1 FL=1
MLMKSGVISLKKLYEKNELAFALVWIGAYVVLFSLADGLSEGIGMPKLITALVGVAVCAGLLVFCVSQGLLQKYGLCRPQGKARAYCYYLPILVIASCNLWCGVTMNASVAETCLHILSMVCVGFIEELLFRGFLFEALRRDNVNRAIIISSVTFGFGHIVNLLNGAQLLPTALQMMYAVAIGFAFTILFYKSKSLLVCIAAHSFVNSTSVFAVESSTTVEIVTALGITAIAGAYALLLLRPQRETPKA